MAHERSRSYHSDLEVATPADTENINPSNRELGVDHRESQIFTGGLEAVPQAEDKIVHSEDEGPGKKLLGSDLPNGDRPPSYQTHIQSGNTQQSDRPRRSLKLYQLALIVLGVIVFLGLVVAVPVAITQTRKNSGSPSTSTTSPSGAMRGTGLVVSNPGNGVDNLWLFYQDYTGDLHRSIYSSGAWQKGTSLGLSDAANGTGITMMVFPLDANSTLQSGSSIVHIAYAGTDLLLHDALLNTSALTPNPTTPFTPGLLSASNFSLPSPLSSSHLSFALDAYNRTSLFASGPDGLIHEYLWEPTMPSPSWNDTFTFPTLSGYAAPGPGVALTTITLHGINPFSDQLQLWWKTVSVNSSGEWNQGATTSQGNLGADGVWRNTSVVVGNGQMAFSGEEGGVDLIGYTGTMAAERWGGVTATGIQAMRGSRVAGVGASKGITDLFVQVNGSDVVHFVGGGGSWGVEQALPV